MISQINFVGQALCCHQTHSNSDQKINHEEELAATGMVEMRWPVRNYCGLQNNNGNFLGLLRSCYSISYIKTTEENDGSPVLLSIWLAIGSLWQLVTDRWFIQSPAEYFLTCLFPNRFSCLLPRRLCVTNHLAHQAIQDPSDFTLITLPRLYLFLDRSSLSVS